jgi:uncharacterized phiE125 gp8 family phage protein
MSLRPNLGPAVEPIAVADLKTHLRLDSAAEDAMLASLITTARLQVEAALSLALITQHWIWTLNCWPEGASLPLPMTPIQSISAITVYQTGGPLTLPAAAYLVDGTTTPARLMARTPWLQPTDPNGITVRFVAGFGPNPADVPAPIRQAILVLAAHWYNHRDTDPGCAAGAALHGQPTSLPVLVSQLLQPYRRPRL